MADFVLFGTEGCHLCEEAEQLLLQTDVNFEKRDIMADEQALQCYAIRIPVLLNQASGLELAWPFDMQQLEDFIA